LGCAAVSVDNCRTRRRRPQENGFVRRRAAGGRWKAVRPWCRSGLRGGGSPRIARIALEERGMLLKWLGVLLMVIVVSTALWASDKITYEGERTIHTVRCEQGAWEERRCTGRMVAGDRYRFRASKSRQEVIYWIVGSARPSGKFTSCKVRDRGNWKCDEATGQPPTITREMVNDRPTRDSGGTTVPFHAVPKWQWWILDAGIHLTTPAVY
jgi:hypothetical protein